MPETTATHQFRGFINAMGDPQKTTEEGVPAVTAYESGISLNPEMQIVTVPICPFCAGAHTHGIRTDAMAQIPSSAFENRLADCGGGAYDIVNVEEAMPSV